MFGVMAMFIAVIGGSQCSNEDALLAEHVGAELARRGIVLVCGGLGGVMEAACKGASSESGLTIGILPGNYRGDSNQYVQIPIVTGLGYARNSIVVQSAQAVIAIDGQYGTLSEIAYAVQYGIPVIGLNTWSLCKGEKFEDTIIVANDATDAVGKAEEAASKGGT
jgi:uncharacterized protein (TIGR00725 family)